MRISPLVIVALGAALGVSAALAAPAVQRDVVLRGLATDEAGRPIPGVKVACTGALEASTVGSSSGRFTLTLRPGPYAQLARRPMRFEIEVTAKGKHLHVADGPAKLELTIRGVIEDGVAVRSEAQSNHAPFAAALTRSLADPAQDPAEAEVQFTSAKSGKPAKAGATAGAGSSATAPPPVSDAASQSAANAKSQGSPPPAASAAPQSAPPPPAPKSPPPAAVVPQSAPAAGAASAPSAAAPGAAAGATAGAAAGAAAHDPLPARGETPSSEIPPKSEKAAAPPPAPRKPPKDPQTALEMLEASKVHGTVFVSEAYRESVRAAFRAQRRQERDAELQRRTVREQLAHSRDSLEAYDRALKASRATTRRESLSALERWRKAERERGRSAVSVRERLARDSLALAARSRDSVEALARAYAAVLEIARRDSVRIAQRAKDSRREAERRDRSVRSMTRRDSMLAALRLRDSLRWVQHVQDSTSAAVRRDSIRASRPPGPALDPRPPVGGRRTAADTCGCRIEGTVEVKSDQPLPSPLRVTVVVRGMTSLRDRVDLFMGPPREFTIERVPCGTRSLELFADPECGLIVRDPDMIGPFDCTGRTLVQPRIVLVPR